jgi:hypothetical protein
MDGASKVIAMPIRMWRRPKRMLDEARLEARKDVWRICYVACDPVSPTLLTVRETLDIRKLRGQVISA